MDSPGTRLDSDFRKRKRMTSQDVLEAGPREAGFPRAAAQPLPPRSEHATVHAADGIIVATPRVVVVVPLQLPRKSQLLRRNRVMTMTPAPVVDPRDRTTDPTGGGLRFDSPTARTHPALKPRSSNVSGFARPPPEESWARPGRWKRTSRVFFGWSVRPYLAKR